MEIVVVCVLVCVVVMTTTERDLHSATSRIVHAADIGSLMVGVIDYPFPFAQTNGEDIDLSIGILNTLGSEGEVAAIISHEVGHRKTVGKVRKRLVAFRDTLFGAKPLTMLLLLIPFVSVLDVLLAFLMYYNCRNLFRGLFPFVVRRSFTKEPTLKFCRVCRFAKNNLWPLVGFLVLFARVPVLDLLKVTLLFLTFLLWTSFSLRRQEYEADEKGLNVFMRAGYDPAEMVSALGRLIHNDRYERRTLCYFFAATHPPIRARVKRLKYLIKKRVNDRV